MNKKERFIYPSDFKNEIPLFKFSPHRITKLDPVGNKIKGLPCPKPRSGHRIVVMDGDIYSFGGYNPRLDDNEFSENDVLFKEIWRFNYPSKTWMHLKVTGPIAEEVASHCAVLIEKYMLIYGGTGFPFGNASSNLTHVCDLQSLQWYRPETSGDIPEELYGQALTVSENKMYVVGGTSGFDYSISVHCLDFGNNTWKKLSANVKWEPNPRYRHEIALYKNKIYILGGGTSNICYDFQKIPVFDIEECCWSYVNTSEDCPTPRRCHGLVQMGSDVYICGGLQDNTVFSDIWKLNLDTLKWTKFIVTLPTELYFHAASLSEVGQLFVFGGVPSAWSNDRINDIFSMWLCVPHLSDMCWEAVLHYIPHISKQRKEKLFKAGIPIHYLNKIVFDSPPDGNFHISP